MNDIQLTVGIAIAVYCSECIMTGDVTLRPFSIAIFKNHTNHGTPVHSVKMWRIKHRSLNNYVTTYVEFNYV